MSLGGHNTSVTCQLGTQNVPRGLTGEYKSTRAWQAASDPALSFANQNKKKITVCEVSVCFDLQM